MQVSFIKLDQTQFNLKCEYKDEILLDKTLDAKSFLKYHLMHFCVEKNAHLQNSFFGNLKNKIDTRVESLRTEKVVKIMQLCDNDSNFSINRYLSLLQGDFYAISEAKPEYICDQFVEIVYKQYIRYLNVYKYLKSGGNGQLVLFF
jgi:hypothetical protein